MNAQNNHATKVGVALVLIMGGLFGCSSVPSDPGGRGDAGRSEATQHMEGVPQWVNNLGAFSGERHVLYGVGSAEFRNFALRRRSAEAAARLALAENMKTAVAGLYKGYVAETASGNQKADNDEKHAETVLKTVTGETLMGSQIVEYWENPKNPKQAYALARLDIEQFLKNMEKYKSSMEQFKEIDGKLKEYIRNNSNKLHEELNKELEKRSTKR